MYILNRVHEKNRRSIEVQIANSTRQHYVFTLRLNAAGKLIIERIFPYLASLIFTNKLSNMTVYLEHRGNALHLYVFFY